MRHTLSSLLALVLTIELAGCVAPPERKPTAMDQINAELNQATQQKARPAAPAAVADALIPPLQIDIPGAARSTEQKFDLVVNGAPANQVFMGIVHGTRYSMLVHPEVNGTISVNLKDVTVMEALQALRDLYGYDFRVEGNRIFVQSLTMQSRVFQVNYLTAQRKGSSDVRVVSGSVSDAPRASTPGAGAPTTTTGGTSESIQSTRISTTSDANFWSELSAAVRAIVGTEGGRSVVVSPQSGVIVVRALPNELRAVEQYLKASQGAVDRQVILEAKIIEVELSDGYQTGINWAAFSKGPGHGLSVGTQAPGTVLQNARAGGALATGVSSIDYTARTYTGSRLNSVPGQDVATDPSLLGGIFGLAFRTSSFAALLSFLETQGGVQVLSSPRIATLNNQKAVLKVGTDDFFVTNVSTTTTTGTASTTTPNVTLQPFFSGIVLDVTPQIDENDNITLHIHPSVSTVVSKTKDINLGTAGSLSLPLASSTVSETDSIVRAQDGQVVAIGGLMKTSSVSDRSQVPGVGDVPVVGNLFKQTSRTGLKKELVILLKATVIKDSTSWSNNILESQRNIENITRPAAIQ